MNSAQDVWTRVLDLLLKSGQLSAAAKDTWFDDTMAVELSDGRLVVHCPADFKRDVIISRFLPYLQAVLRELFSGEFELLILGQGELEPFLNAQTTQKSDAPRFDAQSMTFSRFVVGNSNKFAHAASIAVAEQPGTAYNPLFIYGASGLGKTHLLYAISHTVKQRTSEAQILYVKGDQFTNELIHAIQTGKNVEFRQKYRSADLFLIDDIQFIAGKDSTQEEFFHTFNELYESGCQIVMTSDRPPMEIMKLDDRLKTRFEWGLLADIQSPDYETRMAIIKNKGQQLALTIPDEVANYIAEHITTNVRQLEGIVKKLTAYRELLQDHIDLNSVIRAIKDMFKESGEELPTIDIIVRETANFFSLPIEELRSRNRSRNITLARQISMYLIRKLTNLSFSDIAKEYDGKDGRGMDHSTVLSSVNKIEILVKEDTGLKDTIRDITANIHSISA